MASGSLNPQSPKERVSLPVKLDQWLARIASDSGRTRNYLFGLVAGLLGVSLIFGIVQLSDTLRSPFVYDGNQASGIDARKTQQLRTLDELRKQDTDQDGLDDYAELYVFETSPYTPDSDSDGYDDAEEVESNNDPNCPSEETCDFSVAGGDQLNPSPLPSDAELTTVEIRQLLINSGVPAVSVEQLSDEQVRQVYAEARGETLGKTGTANRNTNTSTQTSELQQLLALTPSEIRTFLVSSGVSETELAAFSDEQVSEIFLASLTQQYGEDAVLQAIVSASQK